MPREPTQATVFLEWRIDLIATNPKDWNRVVAVSDQWTGNRHGVVRNYGCIEFACSLELALCEIAGRRVLPLGQNSNGRSTTSFRSLTSKRVQFGIA